MNEPRPSDSPGTSPMPEKTPEFYKAPSRFDLATVFAVTFAYAIFWGAMNAAGAEVSLTASILGALTLIGVVQMILPDAYVRIAAVICGWIAFAVAGLAILATSRSRIDADDISGLACSTIFFGGLVGYCGGVVVAGVFLVADRLRRFVRRFLN